MDVSGSTKLGAMEGLVKRRTKGGNERGKVGVMGGVCVARTRVKSCRPDDERERPYENRIHEYTERGNEVNPKTSLQWISLFRRNW